MSVFMDRLMAHYDAIGATPGTKSHSRRAFAELARRTGVRTTADLDDDHIRRFVRIEGESPSSYWGLMRSIRAGCNHAVEMGLIPTAPVFPPIPQPGSVPLLTTRRAGPELITEEIGRFFDHLREHSGDWEFGRLEMLCALVMHGQLLPNSEASRVMWRHLNDGMIEVPRRSAMTRSSAPKSVPISAPLRVHLDRWRPLCGSDYIVPNKSRTGFWNGGGPGKKPIDCVKAIGRSISLSITLDSIFEYGMRHAVPTLILPESSAAPASGRPVLLAIATPDAAASPSAIVPTPPELPTGPLDPNRLTRLMALLLRESGSWEGCRLYALAMTVLYRSLRTKTAIQLPVAACDLKSGMIRIPGRPFAEPIDPALGKARREMAGSPRAIRVARPFPGRRISRPLDRRESREEGRRTSSAMPRYGPARGG